LYGLVQAARQFYLKFSGVLQDLGFTISYADPCLFHRVNQYGRIIMIVHVDDCYTIGDPNALDHIQRELEDKGLKVKTSKLATDYLSCDIKINTEKTRAWIGQTTLLRKVIDKYQPIIANHNYQYKTPGTPKMQVLRPSEDDGALSPTQQTDYRSGVGTLLQFSGKTRPDLANPVRELAKCMDRASPAALKEMYRIIKYLIDTKEFGLKLFPNNLPKDNHWEMVIYSDSDWAGDKTTRKIVTGFTIFLQGAPILWRSQTQKTVSLSSSEAEYYAVSEAAKEIKFLVQVLESLNINVKKPIIVHIDNVGAIFIAETPSTTKHTRHIDARYHFIREYIIDGVITIVFVSSAANKADMFTKNVTSEAFESHIDNFIVQHYIIKTTTEELEKYAFFDSGRVSELVPYDSIVKSNNGINGIKDSPIPIQELGLDENDKYYANDTDNNKYYANDTNANRYSKINKYLLARYQNRQDLSKYTKDDFDSDKSQTNQTAIWLLTQDCY
jgi:Reverse transcriptase (RNA-dependent DNA polymerase)